MLRCDGGKADKLRRMRCDYCHHVVETSAPDGALHSGCAGWGTLVPAEIPEYATPTTNRPVGDLFL